MFVEILDVIFAITGLERLKMTVPDAVRNGLGMKESSSVLWA